MELEGPLMISIDRMAEDDWQTLRDLRLRALAEAPYAFWATHAGEAAFTEAEWRRFLRVATWFVGRRDGQVLGMAAGLLREETPTEPELLGMWVAPGERGRGVGGLLVQEVLSWATSVGAGALTLWVTDGNAPARRLYERAGFRPTGERGSMPHGAAAYTERMRLALNP